MFTYRIEQDDCEFNPREDYDTLGTMVCWHSRYNLGDEQPNSQASWLAGMLVELGLERPTDHWDAFYYMVEIGHTEEMGKAFDMICDRAIVLPLYLYDHSGITMRTSPFSCPWDSGQVGWIYVTLDKVREEFNWTRITKQRREEIVGYLQEEVKVYDQYLTGDVWGYIVEDEEGEELDSCWGFFGYDYCKEEAKRAVEWHTKKRKEKLREQFHSGDKYRDPLLYLSPDTLQIVKRELERDLRDGIRPLATSRGLAAVNNLI